LLLSSRHPQASDWKSDGAGARPSAKLDPFLSLLFGQDGHNEHEKMSAGVPPAVLELYYKLTSRRLRLRLKKWSLALLVFGIVALFLLVAWAIETGKMPSAAELEEDGRRLLHRGEYSHDMEDRLLNLRPTGAPAPASTRTTKNLQNKAKLAGLTMPNSGHRPSGVHRKEYMQELEEEQKKKQQEEQHKRAPAPAAKPVNRPTSHEIHSEYKKLIREYPFQPVRNERGDFCNIILVRAPMESPHQMKMFERLKNDILFIGLSSFETFPLPSPNPFSGSWPEDKYLGLFPGFLHMMRDPSIFPSHVKLLLMSQSDFALPNEVPTKIKKYDFTFSGSDQDVHRDCVGWASFAKNWSFVKESLEVMCGELNMTGVLVATKDKKDKKACSIPKSCEGRMIQTKFLDQGQFFRYAKQSKFVFLPQVYDASPRVSTQALSLDVPVLMNYHIKGGWKYVNEKTGEFFHDMSDFRDSLRTLLDKVEMDEYTPRTWVMNNYGDQISGSRLKDWIEENFADRVLLPPGTKLLYPSGA